MNPRKKSLKILALLLSAALMGIGAAPAAADCDTECCCKAPSRMHLQDISSIHHVTRHMQEYQRMHDGTGQVHAFFLLVQSEAGNKGCERKTAETSCNMEPLAKVDVLHCTLHTNPHAEYHLYSLSFVNTGMIGNDSLSYRSATYAGLTVRAGPQPLYLQNLTLLI